MKAVVYNGPRDWPEAEQPDRLARLIAPLSHDDPVQVFGRQQCALLEQMAFRGEFRGEPPRPDLGPRPSLARS